MSSWTLRSRVVQGQRFAFLCFLRLSLRSCRSQSWVTCYRWRWGKNTRPPVRRRKSRFCITRDPPMQPLEHFRVQAWFYVSRSSANFRKIFDIFILIFEHVKIYILFFKIPFDMIPGVAAQIKVRMLNSIGDFNQWQRQICEIELRLVDLQESIILWTLRIRVCRWRNS
jgi:hypothetical protein